MLLNSPFTKVFSTFLFIAAGALTGFAQAPVLYGMTPEGGRNGVGTIFSFNLAGNTEKVLHSFARHGFDGNSPTGSLALDNSTNILYGLTYGGGQDSVGAIISYDPASNFESLVYSFTGPPDGGLPMSNLTWNAGNGLFYGITYGGGGPLSNSGTIISFNPTAPLQDSVLYRFAISPNNSDAARPFGALTYNSATGLYYGLSLEGGDNYLGAIFSFNPATGSENLLYSFTAFEGNTPKGDLVYYPPTGLFYGLTTVGGTFNTGTIFSFDPTTHNEQVVYNFSSSTDAVQAVGNLVYLPASGLFYGVSIAGGIHNWGTIFTFNPATDSENVVFSGNTGTIARPVGNMVYDAGNHLFYGLSSLGGAHSQGTIYSFNPATNGVQVLWSFGADSDGTRPNGSLILLNGPNAINAVNKQDENVNIYPNPSSGAFTVTGLQPGQTVEINNYLGQQISRFTATGLATQQFDISSVANGIYLLQVINADGNTAGFKKMVKTN